LLLYGLTMSRFPRIFYRRGPSKQLMGMGTMIRSPQSTQFTRVATHRILLDAIGNALEDILHHGAMIAMRFVVTKAHHVPIFTDSIPTYFDDAVVDLIAAGLQTDRAMQLSICHRSEYLHSEHTVPTHRRSHALCPRVRN
jgi:hypothetical protein